MRLTDERYEEIKEEVTDLFIRYNVRCIPISGFELAMKMGIILIPYSSLSPVQQKTVIELCPDGFYTEPGDGSERIYYNDIIGYERSNMTILHEIGHAVLGHHNDMDHDEAEAEAKFFAKYAAAPPPLIHQICPNYPEDIEAVFMISLEAAYYAFGYYHKWLQKHLQTGLYLEYEHRLLRLFREYA